MCVHVFIVKTIKCLSWRILCYYLYRCLEENEYKRYPSHDLMTHPFVIPSPLSARSIKTSLVNDPNAFTPGIITNGIMWVWSHMGIHIGVVMHIRVIYRNFHANL